MKAIINNQLVEKGQIVLDQGYFYGYGAFETIYIREGQPIFLKEHLHRLQEALVFLELNQRIEEEEVKEAIQRLRAKNIGLKINVSEKNIVYSLRPITPAEKDYKLGLSKIRRHQDNPMTRIKSMNYTENLLAIKAAKKAGYDAPLFINTQGEVCETATANLFVCIDGQWQTPKGTCGLLEGILRKWVMTQLPVKETSISYQGLLDSEGIFITNSLMGIMPVKEIDGYKIEKEEMSLKLQKMYKAYLEKGV